MMKIFLDTEFTGFEIDASLISIGLVTETGDRTFYAELTDSYTLHQCSYFVQEEVLPHLAFNDIGLPECVCSDDQIRVPGVPDELAGSL